MKKSLRAKANRHQQFIAQSGAAKRAAEQKLAIRAAQAAAGDKCYSNISWATGHVSYA